MGMLLHRQGEKRKKPEQSSYITNQSEHIFPPNEEPARQETNNQESEEATGQKTSNKHTKRETKK